MRARLAAVFAILSLWPVALTDAPLDGFKGWKEFAALHGSSLNC